MPVGAAPKAPLSDDESYGLPSSVPMGDNELGTRMALAKLRYLRTRVRESVPRSGEAFLTTRPRLGGGVGRGERLLERERT